MNEFNNSSATGHGHILEQESITINQRERTLSGASSIISNPSNVSVNSYEANFQQQNQSTAAETSSSSNWMENVWAPPNLLSVIAGGDELDQSIDDFSAPIHHQMPQHSAGSFHSNSSAAPSGHSQPCLMMEQISPNLKRPGPIRQQQQYSERLNEFVVDGADYLYRQMPPAAGERALKGNSSNDCQIQLVVIKQPEEQHRARYASEGSRGAIKDRSGTTYCSVQLVGYYRPTRVELFAAEKDFQGRYVQHSQYKLITVAGKSSTMTPCKRIIAEDETERLEIVLRPENRMIGILDCIGIMKICSYGSPEAKRPRKRKRKSDCGDEQLQEVQHSAQQNSVYIVARAFVPLSTEDGGQQCQPSERIHFEIFQAVTEPIRCGQYSWRVPRALSPRFPLPHFTVQQLGTPDVLKMSMESCAANGGQELFIIGRNFDPKDTQILFREYKSDGSLGWNAEATIDRRFLHQCHVVCQIPAYQNLYRNATVSLTIICGAKQSHPKNFHYTACEREDDDDWRPPDCSFGNNNFRSQQRQSSAVAQSLQQQSFDYTRRKSGTLNPESPEGIFRHY